MPGRPRTIAKVVGASSSVCYAVAGLYLATFHPFDVAVGVTMAVALGVTAFRLFTPNEIFPVTYGGGKKAHLDVGGERGEAIRRALQDQLGLTVVDLKPVGLAGSGGSTPLRLRVARRSRHVPVREALRDEPRPSRSLVQARTHGDLRPARGRGPVLVGAAARPVRGLHAEALLRLRHPHGRALTASSSSRRSASTCSSPSSSTARRRSATRSSTIDDEIIDHGLLLIRTLWDAGLAHRDIKPANLLVRDRQVLVIDVAFAQVRPSPWRQAIDLANMMLVLAVRTDSQRVYERALRFFTPDEIAEAFAAARGSREPVAAPFRDEAGRT